jgi:hypothetical protein
MRVYMDLDLLYKKLISRIDVGCQKEKVGETLTVQIQVKGASYG